MLAIFLMACPGHEVVDYSFRLPALETKALTVLVGLPTTVNRYSIGTIERERECLDHLLSDAEVIGLGEFSSEGSRSARVETRESTEGLDGLKMECPGTIP